MPRLQLAINVGDLETSIAFYSRLFATEPAKVRVGYANFAIDDPPLKLVLIEQSDTRGSGVVGALNHLGIEVETADQVGDAVGQLQRDGITTDLRQHTTCCYALQDKVWVDDPDQLPWEIYTVLADADDGMAEACSTNDAAAAPDCSPAQHCC